MGDLLDRARQSASEGFGTTAIIREALESSSIESIQALQIFVRELDDDMVHRTRAGVALVCKGPIGIGALREAAHLPPRMKVSTTFFLTTAGVAGKSLKHLVPYGLNQELLSVAERALENDPMIRASARSALVDYLIEEPQDDVMYHYGHALSQLAFGEGAFGSGGAFYELIAASSARWIAISESKVREYESLLSTARDDERVLHRFLEQNPSLLDPLAAEVWSKPDLHGRFEADFVVRRFDDSYSIVEIETPGKRLYTAHQPTSEVTHALQQARDYRAYLSSHLPEARQLFPRYEADAECHVVIGMENELNEDMRLRLSIFNSDLQRSHVTGFDLLATRARALRSNLMISHETIIHSRLS